MKVKILGIFESPVDGDPDSEVVIFDGACKVGKMEVESNRYHRLEIFLEAEPLDDDEPRKGSSADRRRCPPVRCRVCDNEIEDCNAICTDCEGDVRDDER